MSERTTEAYEAARDAAASLLNAADRHEDRVRAELARRRSISLPIRMGGRC
jgi:hypothetical protein